MTHGICTSCKCSASTIVDGRCEACRQEVNVDIEIHLGALQFMGDQKLVAFDTDNCIVACGDNDEMLFKKFQAMVAAHVYTCLQHNEKPFQGGYPLEPHRAEQFDLSTDQETRDFEFNVTTPLVSPRYKVSIDWRKTPV